MTESAPSLLEQPATILIPEGMTLGQFLVERIKWGSDSLGHMLEARDEQVFPVALNLQIDLPGAVVRDLARRIVASLGER